MTDVSRKIVATLFWEYKFWRGFSLDNPDSTTRLLQSIQAKRSFFMAYNLLKGKQND